MSTKRETLKQAVARIRRRGLRCGLDGCPEGSWPETRQALLRLQDELPPPAARTYTFWDVVEALYVVDHNDRWRVR
jgi:hypothetical protein